MSVINDMLRDLETRIAPERQAPAGLPRSLVAQKSHKSKWLLALIVFLVLALATSLWFLFKPKQPSSAAAVSLIETLPPTAAIPELPAEEPGARYETTTLEERKALASFEPSEKTNEAPAGNPKLSRVVTPAQKQRVEVAVRERAPEKRVVETEVVLKADKTAEPTKIAQPLKEKSAPIVIAKSDNSKAKAPRSQPAEARVAQAPIAPALAEPKAAGVVLTPQAKDQANASQAASLLKKGYSREVVDSLYRFIAENNIDSLSRVVLARQLLASKRLVEAGDLLVSVDGRSIAPLRELKARWYATQGMLDAALATLNSARPEVEKHPEYYALMASYYQQGGQFAEAVDTYSLLLEQNSDVADWWVGMAIGLDQMQRYKDAALAYRQALALPNLKSSLASFSESRLQQLTL